MQQRADIRRALKGLLGDPLPATDPKAYRTAAGPKVFASRTAPITPKMLPAIMVFVEADDRDPDHQAPDDGDQPQRRLLTLAVEGGVAGEDADDAMDALCLEIDRAVQADPTLGGRVESLTWTGDKFDLVSDPEGDEMVVVRRTYTAAYWALPAPADDGAPITTVYGSWAPKIGPEHVADYQDITDGSVPDNF